MAIRVKTKYQANNGYIHPISLKQETLLSAAIIPDGEVTNAISAKVSKGNRQYGLRPRGVVISRTFGIEPDTFKRYAFIPVLTLSAFNKAPFLVGYTIIYKEEVWTVESLVSESSK